MRSLRVVPPDTPMNDPRHVSVLLARVCEFVAPRSGGSYIDVTTGLGGHSEAILEASSPSGTLICIDRDPTAIERSKVRLARFGERVEFYLASMSMVREVLDGRLVDGLVADLGVSSPQLDEPERGMSFRHEGPLDMRMGPDAPSTAWQLVRDLSETELANAIYEYGEERRSRPVARSIKRAIDEGKMETTKDLAAAIYRVMGPPRFGTLDPATRTFQGLRIAVNNEMGELRDLLAALPDVLADDGVAAVISFHSLEDRQVKHAFRESETLEALTKKPVEPDDEECRDNPRARSAKMRAARRLARDTETP
jgi:16S rRNA (cytosine1402-N4)-methyltransferase